MLWMWETLYWANRRYPQTSIDRQTDSCSKIPVRDCLLYEHLKKCAKNIFMNFTVCPNIKFYKTNAEKERDTKEKHFISLYKPELNE